MRICIDKLKISSKLLIVWFVDWIFVCLTCCLVYFTQSRKVTGHIPLIVETYTGVIYLFIALFFHGYLVSISFSKNDTILNKSIQDFAWDFNCEDSLHPRVLMLPRTDFVFSSEIKGIVHHTVIPKAVEK